MRVPDNHAAFIQKLKPYYRTWAGVTFGERKVFKGQPSESIYTHVFTIRTNLEISIEDTDLIIWENELFAIRTFKPLGLARLFTSIRCIDYKKLTELQKAAGITQAEVIDAEMPEKSNNTVFWEQLKASNK